jgi:hypothetical protein
LDSRLRNTYAMAPAAAGDVARPVRMPRLTYRNPLPADQLSLSSAHTSSSDTPSNEPSADQRLSTANSTGTLSPIQANFDASSVAYSGLSSLSPTVSLASNASTSKDSKAPKKKKTNGVLGFLTLKEPSHSALEQFAEQQRKLASEKGPVGKASIGNSFALGTVSPQKLPASVPKVNSKWDGIPEAQRKSKDKESIMSKRKSTASSNTTSRFSGSSATNGSILSTSSDGSSRTPPNSIVSTASSGVYESSDRSCSQSTIGSHKDYGPSVSTSNNSYSIMNSASMTSLPAISYFFPDDPNASGSRSPLSQELSVNGKPPISPAPAVQNPPISKSLQDVEGDESNNTSSSLPAMSKPRSSVFSNLDHTEEFSHSGSVASPVMRKHLEPEDLIDTEAIFRVLSKPQGLRPGEVQDMQLPESHSFLVEDAGGSSANGSIPVDDDETSDSDSDSNSDHSFILPVGDGYTQHTTMNFSRPLSVPSGQMFPDPAPLPRNALSHRRTPSGLPTLYEVSIASSQDVTVEATESDTPRQSMDSIAPSIAPSLALSVTPSVMSDSWYQSPRERLGLGGPRMWKTGATPWDNDGKLPPGKPKRVSRLSLFSKG